MDARHHTIKKSKNNKKTKITQHVIPFTSRRSESVELLFQKYTLNIKVSGPWDTNRRDATPTKALRIRSGCDSNWCVCVCVSRISRSVDFPPTSFVICTRSSPRIRIRRFRTGYLDGWPLCCVFFFRFFLWALPKILVCLLPLVQFANGDLECSCWKNVSSLKLPVTWIIIINCR